MQFVFFYYLIKRMFRAVKVVFLLIRRRDLVKQLPGGYLADMAKSNHWFQMQLVGIVAFILWTVSAVILEPGTGGGLLAVLFLIGIVAMTMNLARLIVRR